MRDNNLNDVLTTTINNAFASVALFIPRFISGLIVLLLGIVIATFLKQIIVELFKFTKFELLLRKYGVPEARDNATWSNIIAEMIRWFVIIIFLVPTADLWGLGKFSDVLNGLLRYLPNVFVAVMLLLIGFVVARLVYDLILTSVHGLSKDTARTIAVIGRWSVLIFVFLAVLNQLGIASDLIRILFAGVVAMIALAGGLSLGLGGKDVAREFLEKIMSSNSGSIKKK